MNRVLENPQFWHRGADGDRHFDHLDQDRDFDHFHRDHFHPFAVFPFWSPYGFNYGYPYYPWYYLHDDRPGYGYGSTYAYGGYGYGPYGGPQYTYDDYDVDDYSTDLPPSASESEYAASADISAGEQFLSGARDAFARKQYNDALRLANHAAVEVPRTAKAHELMSLALFALQDYHGANLEAHAALSLGPASDWPTLYGYYGNLPTYNEQLDTLVEFIRKHPPAPEGRFVLAYHDLMMGHRDAAKQQLEKVVAAVPQDKVAADLLKELKGGAPQTSEKPQASEKQPPEPALPQNPASETPPLPTPPAGGPTQGSDGKEL